MIGLSSYFNKVPIGRVVGRRLRLRGVTVAPEVCRDDGELAGEPRGDLVPHGVGLGVAVEQQERRATATVADPNLRLACIDHRRLEPLEHPSALTGSSRAPAFLPAV